MSSGAWQHTSWLMTMLANINRDVKKKPEAFTPENFDLFASKRETPVVATKADMESIRAFFTGAPIQEK
jgi:hypothetical protein